MLYDHVDLRVSDITHTRPLYDTLMGAMGFTCVVADADSVCYYWPDEDRARPFLGLVLDPEHRPNATRLALRASDRAEVDRLAALAVAAGARAFEPPHVCEEYRPLYYASFFEDADGNKLEICYRSSLVSDRDDDTADDNIRSLP